MTENKARKRAVRARMSKTGERYTAARRHLIEAEEAVPAPVADPGFSDESIRKGTGRGWDEWLPILDAWGATSHSHGEIARYVNEEHGVDGWWSQTVTVGYERARGMRARHQRLDGAFEVSVSKTYPVALDVVYQAFVESRRRNRWLEAGTLKTRTSQPGKGARFDFGDGESRVAVWFTAKGPEKTSVTIQHGRLPDAGAVEETRAFWKERLARLAEKLGPRGGVRAR